MFFWIYYYSLRGRDSNSTDIKYKLFQNNYKKSFILYYYCDYTNILSVIKGFTIIKIFSSAFNFSCCVINPLIKVL